MMDDVVSEPSGGAVPRCMLFVPAHVERMTSKARAIAVDAFVLDLEDAVPPSAKTAAREGARRFLAACPRKAFVRINPLTATTVYSTGSGLEDVAGVVRPGIRGVILPKAEAAADSAACDAAIAEMERQHGMRKGQTELYAIVETALGVCNAVEIARAVRQRPYRLCFGAGDFTTDIGVEWTADEDESRVARSLIVLASRAAGIGQPIDSVFTDIADAAGLARSAATARKLGFGGKFAIHPSQIESIESAFTPGETEVQWARDVIAKLAIAEREGAGAFVVDGKMIDYPIVERARRLLAAWELARQRG